MIVLLNAIELIDYCKSTETRYVAPKQNFGSVRPMALTDVMFSTK